VGWGEFTNPNNPDHGVFMILEVAALNVKPGHEAAFEKAFGEAQSIIGSMPGFISLKLRRCLETSNRYLLLVEWEKLEDHIIGFRQSPQYRQWKKLLHHFYYPFRTFENYEKYLTYSFKSLRGFVSLADNCSCVIRTSAIHGGREN
jgi:heme-degrading monooxygenase HmoA